MGRLCMELVMLGTRVGQGPAPAAPTDLTQSAGTGQTRAEGSGERSGGTDTQPEAPAPRVRAEDPGIQIPEERG